MAVDNFNRPDNFDMGADWFESDGPGNNLTTILNNQCRTISAATANAWASWVGNVFSGDQDSQALVSSAFQADAFFGLGVRMAVSGNDAQGYALRQIKVAGVFKRQLIKHNPTQGTVVILGEVDGAFTVGNTVKIEAVGTTIRAFEAGVQILSAIDAQWGGGRPGVVVYSGLGASNGFLDDWVGTDVVPPTAALFLRTTGRTIRIVQRRPHKVRSHYRDPYGN